MQVSSREENQQLAAPVAAAAATIFYLFEGLNFIFDTGSWYSFEAKVIRVLLQLKSPISEHRSSRYVPNNQDYSMFKTEPEIGLNIAPL